MFDKCCFNLGCLEQFSIKHLIISLLNQFYILFMTFLFAFSPSYFTALVYLFMLFFNHFHFKLKPLPGQKLGKFIQKNFDRKIICQYKERFVFLIVFMFFLIFTLVSWILPQLIDQENQKNKNYPIIYQIYNWFYSNGIQQSNYLVINSHLDFFCKIGITIYTLIMFKINQKYEIYLDHYKIAILKVFCKYFQIVIFIAMFSLLTYRKIKQQTSYLSILENLIIVYFFIDFFFKFKSGSLRSLHKYIRLLKYVNIANIMIVIFSIFYRNFIYFNNDQTQILRTSVFRMFSYESYVITNYNTSNSPFYTLLILYMFQNYFNYISKFDTLIKKKKTVKFNELYNRPYKLQFIKEFPKQMLKILKVEEKFDKKVKVNLDLKNDFYSQLKSVYFFKKTYEIHLRKILIKQKLGRKYKIYEFVKKYYTIFNIYKYSFIQQFLNITIITIFFTEIIHFNIFSFLYLGLVLVLITQPIFKTIWNSCLIFCLLPNLLMMFLNIFLYTLKVFHNYKFYRVIQKFNKFFTKRDPSQLFMTNSLIFISTSIYLYLNYLIWKKTHKSVQRTIVQNLRDRKLTIIEADEDLLFILKSILRLLLFIIKYVLIYFIVLKSMYCINLINFLTLIMILIHILYQGDKSYLLFLKFLGLISVLKYFSHIDLLFPILDESFFIIFGLSFQSEYFKSNFNFTGYFSQEYISFYIEIFIIYIFYSIYNLNNSIKDERLIETRIFKTQKISFIYNYLVELFYHIKAAVDSTKIYFVYFIIFYFQIYQESTFGNFIEYIFTSIMLIIHIKLYKQNGNVKNKVFYFLFILYFCVLIMSFSYFYMMRFKIYFQRVNIKTFVRDAIDLDLFQKENLSQLAPVTLKLFLTMISLKSIRDQIYKNSEFQNKKQQQQQLDKKLYFRIFQILSIFVKEITLVYTMYVFLQNLNFFGFLYLISYLTYFSNQLYSLMLILEDFRFLDIIKFKIIYFKKYLLDKDKTIDESYLYDKNFIQYNKYYYVYLRKSIFNSIYQNVNQNWTLNFIIIKCYFVSLFINGYFAPQEIVSENIIQSLLFNFKTRNQEIIAYNYIQILYVLFVTVCEVYFITILKYEKSEQNFELQLKIQETIYLRYQILSNILLEKKNEVQLRENKKNLRNLLTNLLYQKIDDFNENKSKNYIDQNQIFVQNLNLEINPLNKTILLSQNKQKLCFLQIVNTVILMAINLSIIPVIIGILQLKTTTMNILGVSMIFLLIINPKFITKLNFINQQVKIFLILEYLVLLINSFLTDFWKQYAEYQNYKQKEIIQDLSENPVQGLFYILCYAAFFKLFFIFMVELCRRVMIQVDQVDIQFLENIRCPIVQNKTFHIIDYQQWVKSKYFIFYQIQNQALYNLANNFFIFSSLFYLSSLGTIEMICLIWMVGFKVYITLGKKKSFADTISKKYLYYYYSLFYCNIIIFGSSIFSLKICQSKRSLFSNILLAFIIIFIQFVINTIKSKDKMSYFKKIKEYYKLREILFIYSQVYRFNEKNIISNLEECKIIQFMEQIFNEENNIQISFKKILADSVFINKNQYQQQLLGQLGFFKTFILKMKIKIRRAFFFSRLSRNFLALVFDFLQNNNFNSKIDIKLDLFELNNYQLQNVFDLITKVNDLQKQNEKTATQQLKKLKNQTIIKNDDQEFTKLILTKEEQELNGTIIAADYFFKQITNEEQSHGILSSEPGKFFDNLYKYEIKEKEFLIVKNFEQFSSELKDYKFSQFSWQQYYKALILISYQNLEVILTFLQITLFCFTSGFLSVFLIFHCLFFIWFENVVYNLKAWKINYLIYISFIVLQTIISYRYKLETTNQITTFFEGNIPNYSLVSQISFFYGKIDYILVLIVFAIYDLILTKICGQTLKDKNFSEIESPRQAVLRITAINGWGKVYTNYNNLIISDLNMIEQQVKTKYKQQLSEKEFMIFMIKLIKQKVFIYRQLKEKVLDYLNIVNKLVTIYNNDRFGQQERHYKNFWWRNFNYFMRKPGINIHHILIGYLCFLLIFFVVFFYKLLGIDESIIQRILQNDIQKTLGINFTILFLFICLERYFYSHYNYRWISNVMIEKDIVKAILNNTKKTEYQPQKDKLKRFLKKCLNIIRLKKPNHYSHKNHYKNNPLLQKYFMLIVFWIYITFLCFFQLPISGHAKKITDSKQITLFCNDTYFSLQDQKNFFGECNNFTSNRYIQLFYLLGNIYVILSLYQIKKGFSILNYFDQSKQLLLNQKDRIQFYFYKYTPFLREITTLIDFLASYTCLNIFQWFKQNDIETSIQEARVNELSNKKKGQKIGRMYKRITGFVFLFFFFFILMAPLFIFSDLIPSNSTNDILGGELVVEVQIKNSKFVLYQNKSISTAQLNETNQDYKKLKNDQFYRKFSNELIWKIIFNKESESYFYITKESIDFIQNVFQKHREVYINIKVTLNTKFKGNIHKQYPFKLKEQNGKQLIQMLTSNECSKEINNRVLLSQQSRLIDLKRINNNVDSLDLNFFYMLKFKCNKKKNKFYFELSDENFDNVSFIIINEQIKNQVEILQKFSKETISITSIYIIIFSYIGITLIRKGFFEQANKFWITETPNAYLLQDTSHLIHYSRLKGNFYKEEKFYYKFLDLFRQPEQIKSLTGKIGAENQ